MTCCRSQMITFDPSSYRIKPKLEELSTMHDKHLLRPTLEDRCEEEELIEDLSQEISKLISATHRQIQYIKSSLGQGKQCKTKFSIYKRII